MDGKAIFINEPIEIPGLLVSNIGFLSHYYPGGSYSVDNIVIRNMNDLTPSGAVSASHDFSANLNSWIMAGSTSNIQWALSSGQLTTTVLGSGGYSFFYPYDLYVSGKTVTVEYDITHNSSSDGWGGFLYRGNIHIDICPNRYGVRDGFYEGLPGNYKWYPSTLTRGASHHVKLKFKPASPYVLVDLTVDGASIFTNEAIETNSFANHSLGFVSNYYSGTVSVDNFSVKEE